MFSQQTTLVLGAGASAPFGFPTGASLRQSIITSISAFNRWHQENRHSKLSYLNHRSPDHYIELPCLTLASYLSSDEGKAFIPNDFPFNGIAEAIAAFGNDFNRQTSIETVDLFIRDNPKHAFIGKALLSQHVLLKQFEIQSGLLRRRSYYLDPRFRGQNWYVKLAGMLREQASNAGDVASKSLYIVSFNYDLSLETALNECLGDTQRHSGAEFDFRRKCFHVNGAPEVSPEVIEDVGNYILRSAESLHLIDEDVSESIKEKRSMAKSAIANSERVFVIGFSFASSNQSTIGFPDNLKPERTFVLNFDGNEAVLRRALRLNIPRGNIMQDPAGQLSIVDAISKGFFEQ